MIYVLFGPSGSGKTTLLEQVYKEYGEKAIHKKGTTRKSRKYDDIEIVPELTEEVLNERYGGSKGYIYSQYGHEYGIERAQLDAAIKGNYPHFVICNDIDTVQKMRKDYGVKIYVVYVKYTAPRDTIEAIQKARDIDDDEIELRLSKIDFLDSVFNDHIKSFNNMLLNNYGETPTELWRKMQAIMAKMEDYRDIPAKEVLFNLIDRLQEKIEYFENREPATGDMIEKDFVFIIMPMMNDDKTPEEIKEELWNICTTIKQSAYEEGYHAKLARDVSGSQTIDAKILNSIQKAEIIVADLSYERPNCYFELGYARAIGKEIIIISKKGTTIHFDVEHQDNFVYESIRQLGPELQAKFSKYRKRRESNE